MLWQSQLLLLLLFLLLFIIRLFTLPQSRTYIPRDVQVNGSDACRGSNSLWTRTLDICTRAGFPECAVSKISGPRPETTQDRIQTIDTHPIPVEKLKFYPPGIEPGPPGRKAGSLPTTSRRRINDCSIQK